MKNKTFEKIAEVELVILARPNNEYGKWTDAN